MRRKLLVVALGVGLVGLGSSAALALAPETVLAHVPFAFNVADRTFPAGDYRIKPLNDIDRQVMVIRSDDGRYAALVMSQETPAETRGRQPELVFDRYGDQRFLHAVELPERAGAVLRLSTAEIQAARDLSLKK